MTLPNFLVIGAAKAGTTSLYHYLRQHPAIFMSPDKEPRYFAFEGDTSSKYPYTRLEDYERLFSGVKNEQAIGEASTIYLYNKDAPQRIRARLPDVKLVAVLRNPVDRVYSNFVYWQREGKEEERLFEKVVEREINKYSQNVSDIYLTRGLYGQQLQRYYKLFPRAQIRVYLYENLCNDPLGLLKDLYAFIGVDPAYVPNLSESHNTSTLPNTRLKQYLYTRLMRAERIRALLLRRLPDRFYWQVLMPAIRRIAAMLRGKARPASAEPMDASVRRRLVEFYREDINNAGKLIGRDLSSWME